jgi:hypothetical protein
LAKFTRFPTIVGPVEFLVVRRRRERGKVDLVKFSRILREVGVWRCKLDKTLTMWAQMALKFSDGEEEEEAWEFGLSEILPGSRDAG